MFCRVVIRNVLPLSFQILKSSTNVSPGYLCKKIIKNTHCKSVLNVSNVPCRFYAKESNLEDMVVDYQHVMNATSNKNILIVDVREPEEVKEHGKIPGSINIPLGTVACALSSISDAEFERTYQRPKPSEETEIIFYCMIGKRSGMAQQNAFNLGYKNVKNYLGSWTDWASKSQ